jgi:hypothetical protein
MVPSIAVIVPNWNDARYLPRCLRSLLEQEVGPDELIVVDDQSTDDSVAVIQSLLAGNPRTQLVINPVNMGANRTVNESLGRARSEYVLLLSANDFVLPGIFAHAKACLARTPGVGLWSALSWLVDENDRTIRLHPSAIVALDDDHLPPERCVKLAYRLGNWFTGSTVIYHRATLQAAGGFHPGYGAPSDLFTALTIASLKGAAYSPVPYAAIRIHASSYSSRALNDLEGLDAMLERLRTRGASLSPELFSESFLERTTARFWFAAVRASGGGFISEVAARTTGWRCRALRAVDQLISARLSIARIGLAFLILRPFDISATLWNRALGWAVVRTRLVLRGVGPP